MDKKIGYSPVSIFAAICGSVASTIASCNPVTAPIAIGIGTAANAIAGGIELNDKEKTIRKSLDNAMNAVWDAVQTRYGVTGACLYEMKNEVMGPNTSIEEHVRNIKSRNLEQSVSIVIRSILQKNKEQLQRDTIYSWDDDQIETTSRNISKELIDAIKGVFENEDDLILLKTIADNIEEDRKNYQDLKNTIIDSRDCIIEKMQVLLTQAQVDDSKRNKHMHSNKLDNNTSEQIIDTGFSNNKQIPKVFISYAWEDDEHRQWVKELANCLLENSIEAIVDQYDLSLGDRLPQFMERSISEADFVLIICTPAYKKKSDNRQGGVGYEGHIISSELVNTRNERKFIPVIRKDDINLSIPVILSGKLGIDLRDGDEYKTNLKRLINTLHGINEKPAIRKNLKSYPFAVDIAFCIDGTGSMSTLKAIKGQAVHLYQDIRYQYEKMGKNIEQIRARIILFRDFLADGNDALMETDFFVLPDETSEFDRIMNDLEARGGGDYADDGLEALGIAIRSKWNNSKVGRKRHIIILWTDSDPHELGFGREGIQYPKEMARNFDELTQWWMNKDMIDQAGKRLLLFAPSGLLWREVDEKWNNVLWYQVDRDNGIKDIDYDTIVKAIVASI